MTLAYCSGPTSQQVLAKANPLPAITRDWSVFERDAVRADRSIILVERLERWPHLDDLRRLRIRMPHIPLILVTDYSPDNARCLTGIDADSVVWTRDFVWSSDTAKQVQVPGLRLRIANILKANGGLRTRERHVLLALFASKDLPRTSDQWARLCHCSRSTLHYHLRKRLAPFGLTARRAINFNLLLAGLDLRPRTSRWRDLGAVLDVDHRRLRDVAAWLVDRNLPSIGDTHPGEFILAFSRLLDTVGIRGSASARRS